MKNLLDKVYDLFSKDLSKWLILAGMICFGLQIFISFLDGMIGLPQEALYYLVLFVLDGVILAGLVFGHYRDREPILVLAFIGFLFLLVYQGIANDAWGLSFFNNAGAPYIIQWLFNFFYGVAFVTFLVFALLIYFFKLKKLSFALEIAYFATLLLGFFAWIADIVYAANGAGWGVGVIPLFELGSLLMIPGLLEELLPGELESPREESEEVEE